MEQKFNQTNFELEISKMELVLLDLWQKMRE